MLWSHFHPALIHVVVGLGFLVLLWDLWRLLRPATAAAQLEDLFEKVLEGWMVLVLLGVATGWLALTHDEIMQHGGRPIGPGEIHGRLGLLILILATVRVLWTPAPRSQRIRQVLAGLDLSLVGLLLGTALLGEWLVFHLGLGLSGVTF